MRKTGCDIKIFEPTLMTFCGDEGFASSIQVPYAWKRYNSSPDAMLFAFYLKY